MSLVGAVKHKKCIIMFGDSATYYPKWNVTLLDSFKVYLDKNRNIGVASCGRGTIKGQSIHDLLESFFRYYESREGDSPEEKLITFFKKDYDEDCKNEKTKEEDLIFIVAYFGEDCKSFIKTISIKNNTVESSEVYSVQGVMKEELIKVFDGVDLEICELKILGPEIQKGYKNVIDSLVLNHKFTIDPLFIPVYPPIDFAFLCCEGSDWISLKPPYDYSN
jgi:hypothetical protein